MKRSMLVAIAFAVANPAAASAAPLSDVALYHRCFVRLTGQYPDYMSDVGLAQVRSGQTTAIDACLALLDRAALRPQGDQGFLVDDDALGRSVLATFHALHGSWFLNRTFPEFDDIILGTLSLYDPTEPASYITRALFQPDVSASSIWTANAHLRVARVSSGEPLVEEATSNSFAFERAPLLYMGPINGVRVAGPLTRAFKFPNEEGEIVPPVEVGAHLGGGFMGASAYLLMNVNETLDFIANGGRKMPRKWAKSVLQDALCRELPAVRIEDAIPFVVAGSEVPFRGQAKCSQCHATMDRMASTIRGFEYAIYFPEEEEDGLGIYMPSFLPVEAPPESGWPAVEDPEYPSRPSNGRLYFRDYQGRLIDLPLDGPAALGAQLAQLDDPYICLAQRYYRYFTGIDAFIGDPANFPAADGSADAYHRQQVITLGRDLRLHGSLRLLIEAIIRSNDYRESDFGAVR